MDEKKKMKKTRGTDERDVSISRSAVIHPVGLIPLESMHLPTSFRAEQVSSAILMAARRKLIGRADRTSFRGEFFRVSYVPLVCECHYTINKTRYDQHNAERTIAHPRKTCIFTGETKCVMQLIAAANRASGGGRSEWEDLTIKARLPWQMVGPSIHCVRRAGGPEKRQ